MRSAIARKRPLVQQLRPSYSYDTYGVNWGSTAARPRAIDVALADRWYSLGDILSRRARSQQRPGFGR